MTKQIWDKVTIYRCKRCHKKIWVPESIIRGMGPICFGKNYVIKKMLIAGKTREQILELTKEQMNELGRKGLKEYKKEQKKLRKPPKVRKIRIKRRKNKKDKNQLTLDLFMKDDDNELEKLKKELYDQTNKLSKTNGTNAIDKTLELMNKIRELEEKVKKEILKKQLEVS